ncbi:hypothetical protein [Sulfurisphaera tokodaii]|uniref:Uncharacterized protein n=2 Tax=Sulfurisphaera tokodaii TaxID=111955 RepID=Q970I4_SULTO|nr:hypothetical protein [Sulfurisphaera tokodaii]BAB66689.1 hypothetical protein STK_16110 [Sulfurisphaera tokodaii str. 7]HII73491.1 hypothetical protein [Sulfurisphaera tokodaii]
MKYPVLLAYYITSLAIVLIPIPWWYYSVGGIFQIYDSPFQINLYFLGEKIIIAEILNILLNAVRIYVAVNLVYGIILSMKGKNYRYSTMFWLPIFYVIDPIIIYLVVDFLVSKALGVPLNYPLVIIGKENLTTKYQGATIIMLIKSYPTFVFWLSLIPVILYIAFLIVEKMKKT